MTGSGEIGDIATGWSIEEDATPVNPTDSSAGTGVISLNAKSTPTSKFIIDNQITVTHDDLGDIDGVITNSSVQGVGVSFSVSTLLSLLVVTKVAPPIGPLNLSTIIQSYVALCSDQITVVYEASNDPIRIYGGWSGEVWYYLKQLAAINQIQFSFSDSNLIVTDLGSTIYELDDSTAVTFSTDRASTGRSINIVNQNTELATPTVITNYITNPSLETNATGWFFTTITYGAATVGRI
jgi:hypothetical protein